MTSALRHVAARDLTRQLKEAVMNALAHEVHARVAGDDEHGLVLLRDRPSNLLSSQFLIPRRRGFAHSGFFNGIASYRVATTGVRASLGTR